MAAELVGSALLSAFLQVVFDRLVSRQVLDYFRGRKLDEKLLNKLKLKLLSINSVVDDAEQKQIQNSRVRDWLLEVKDVVLDAEDLFDEIHCEAMKCELEAESQTTAASKVWNFFNTSFVNSFDKLIESRMKQILDSLEFLSSLKGDLGLKEARGVGVGPGPSIKVSHKLPSTSLVIERVIYGRDYDKKIILKWLTSDTDNCDPLSIISIVGMGGMGKTTLAQHVYNEAKIDDKYDIKAWVCVSDDFDVLTVTRAILEAITKSTDDSRDLEMVQGRLKEKLSEKRFLLVLDDIWNEEQEKWEAVQTPLNYGAEGSRILVTTRTKKVASVVRSNKVHNLMQLQKHHSWQIFVKHALRDDNSELNAELKETGMKIVERCKGLPLALKTIGCLLQTKSTASEWESVLTSEIWDLPTEDSKILPALLLSYHHLPSHLKRCFAYCALFPKDYEFVMKGLVQLWIAENFVQCPQQSKSLDEVGEQYFKDLLSRSFFQQLEKGETRFVMHDLINDLAKYVSGDICFRLGIDKADGIPKLTRHCSFKLNNRYFYGIGSLYDATRLRTFMPTGRKMNNFYDNWHCKMSIHELFSKFKFLRVLSLSGWYTLTEVPDFVGDLKHLRSLDLSYTAIKKLPNSTCSIYNLQILKLNHCLNLKEFPSDLDKLTNLRCLEFIGTKVRKMPMHLGKMKNLQVLSSFFVGGSSEFGIQQLGELNLRGRLSIGELQNIVNPSDALAADLKNKTYQTDLQLEWNRNWNPNQIPDDPRKEREVLENLQPSKRLKKLSIRNYGGTQFPSWLLDDSLLNVVSLTLVNCKYCLSLPPLGVLPFLKDLTIKGLDGIVSIDANFYGNCSSSFISLKKLWFCCMEEWEEWECKAVTGAFPRLQHLIIEQCPKLKGHLPEQLLHLTSLFICECKQLVASAPRAPRIKEFLLEGCGKLQLDYHPTNLRRLTVIGRDTEAFLLEKIGQIIYDTSLEFLSVAYCQNMNIPMSRCYGFLQTLMIDVGCDSLTYFPLDFFPKLKYLSLKCRNLQMISQEHAHNHLKTLKIRKCPQFESFPERMHILLPSLNYLCIEDCPKVDSFPSGGLPSNLTKMELFNCYKLLALLKGALGTSTSLKLLTIGRLDVESSPDEGLLPLSLEHLEMLDCPNLKKLDYRGLCELSSLKILSLSHCPSLKCLPEEGLPKSISTLDIWGNCPLLKQHFLKEKGTDWGKIAHIENIWVGCKPIR